jgi:hypothetical protein
MAENGVLDLEESAQAIRSICHSPPPRQREVDADVVGQRTGAAGWTVSPRTLSVFGLQRMPQNSPFWRILRHSGLSVRTSTVAR